MKKDIVIVGAGLAGSLCALYMLKRGYSVVIYERRSDMRDTVVIAGRSINLALSERGWTAIRKVGIEHYVEADNVSIIDYSPRHIICKVTMR